MRSVAIIPARGGSKVITKKNIKEICGVPLVCWTIKAALDSNINDVILSSEDKEIIGLVGDYNITIRNRPLELSKDNVHSINVVIDCINNYNINKDTLIFMLLPTSPTRTSDNINRAIDLFKKHCISSLVGVCKSNKPESCFRYIDKNNYLIPIKETNNFEMQRQDIKNHIYEVNGAMFVATVAHLMKYRSFHKGNPYAYIMSKTNSIDVNDIEDFKIAESLLCKK